MTKIAIPIGGSCLFVQISKDMSSAVILFLIRSKIAYSVSSFTKADIVIDTIFDALDFTEMIKDIATKLNMKSMEA